MNQNRYQEADGELYQQTRPPYPQAAIEAILAATPNPQTAVDIGAGTGIFARQIAEADPNLHVEAVEPADAMRTGWRPHPRITLREGTSEATGLPNNCADLVVWAQSFHWVQREQTALEAARILKPGGAGAILVNQMDVSAPWVHRLTRIMRSGDVIKENWDPGLQGFHTRAPLVFNWQQSLTVPGVLALARTRSSYLGAGPSQRQRMQDNLTWYLTDHLGYGGDARVSIPYITYLWLLQPPE